VKIRINENLYDQVTQCRKTIDESLDYFVRVAVKKYLAGEFAKCSKSEIAAFTTGKTTVATIADINHPAEVIRLALAHAVAYVASVTPAPFVPQDVYRDASGVIHKPIKKRRLNTAKK